MKGITGNPALDAYHRMAISPVGGARPVERPEVSNPNPTASSAAQVSISSRARDLASEAARDVDTAKVEALKQRIQDGNFRADASVIARNMMEQLG